ncbi:unnamed protein product, partial [Adineta ricciae]
MKCLGGTNNRTYCRRTCPNDASMRYLCNDGTTCISTGQLCDFDVDCSSEDDELLCKKINESDGDVIISTTRICSKSETYQNRLMTSLCGLDETKKLLIKPFQLYFEQFERRRSRSLEELIPESVGRFRRPCHRGVPIQVHNENNSNFQRYCLMSAELLRTNLPS